MAVSYELDWQLVPKLATEHLGRDKYPTSTKALGELISNSFDAAATTVAVSFEMNPIGGIDSITIEDDGHGMSPEILRARFMVVGVEPDPEHRSARFGRFGIGRLAVHRIGSLSQWVSVSQSNDSNERIKISFRLDSDASKKLSVGEEMVPASTPLGTRIAIYNIRDSGQEVLTPTRVRHELTAQFCSYLLGNRDKQIIIQGEALDIAKQISFSEIETIPATAQIPDPTEISHLILTAPVDKSRFPAQVLFTAKGQTVAAEQPDEVPSPRYLGLVECPYLDSLVTSNRGELLNMDTGFSELKQIAFQRVHRFGETLRAQNKRDFIERARQEDYYPYKNAPSDPVMSVRQAVYDVVLEKVHEYVNLENMNRKQQSVMFRLLERSLVNENLLDILHEIASLSDEDVEKFRRVLEYTTLDSIIKLSSDVTDRLNFLDILHKLVYGDVSKYLKERSQLHLILEPHCWIFGPRFHLATSDKSFREIIRRHRQIAELGESDHVEVTDIKGIKDIPDLFLAASREYPLAPKNNHVLIELKAPSVNLGRKQVDQVRRYAETILNSSEFDKQSTFWEVFLVSSSVTDEIDRDRHQKNREPGCLHAWDNMNVWAVEWSELIAKARSEMQLVRDHLRKKSTELRVSDYLRENFPNVLEGLSERMELKDLAAECMTPAQDGAGN